MNDWEAVATENLRKRSAGEGSFDEMKKEWVVSDLVIDNKLLIGNPDDWPSCELCEHEMLRWQFKITNRKNGNGVFIGSTCIKKFDIPITSGSDVLLYGTFRNKILDYKIASLQEEYNIRRFRETFPELTAKDPLNRKKILRLAEYWEAERCLTPAMAYEYISLCAAHSISLEDMTIAVTIQTIDDRIEILHMSNAQYRVILPFLKKTQIARCSEIRKKARLTDST